MRLEHERNAERYNFLKWAQESFENVRIVPPGMGICHQLNIEKFSQVVMKSPSGATGEDGSPVVYFDTLVGTDSHTPTANGIGVLGWGVGGIEAEAADRQAVRGRDGDGRVAHVRLDVEGEGGRGVLRRVLRRGRLVPFGDAARLRFEHDARVRLHLHVVPR